MKRRDMAIAAAAALLIGVYIGTRSGGVSGMTKNDLTMRGKNFIRRINRRDYDACVSTFGKNMRETMDKARLSGTFGPALDTLGSFVRFRTVSFSKPDKLEGDYVLCRIKCDHERGQTTYNILFYKDGEICGLHLK